jgi:hypothetical protein
MSGFYRAAITIFILLPFWGCAGLQQPAQPLPAQNEAAEIIDSKRVLALQKDLEALDVNVNGEEARSLAETVVRSSERLAREYRVVRPPLLHNILVNLRLKNRGLCHHWADDIMKDIRAHDFENYQFQFAVANRGRLFREHTSIVVTTKGQSFEEGIVLDAWRKSGKVFWIKVSDDSYRWSPWDPEGKEQRGQSQTRVKSMSEAETIIHSSLPLPQYLVRQSF